MDRYTIRCTEEQTRKAYQLGAPLSLIECTDRKKIEQAKKFFNNHFVLIDNFQQPGDYWCRVVSIPTAEQMIGWLEEKGFSFYLTTRGCAVINYGEYDCLMEEHNTDRRISTLRAIDVVLEYLINLKENGR